MEFLCLVLSPKNISSRHRALALCGSCLGYELVLPVASLTVRGLEPDLPSWFCWKDHFRYKSNDIMTLFKLCSGSPEPLQALLPYFLKSGTLSLRVHSFIHSFIQHLSPEYYPIPGIAIPLGALDVPCKQNRDGPLTSWHLHSCHGGR